MAWCRCAGRYCILLMSFFSIYTGLLYNEAFSIPMTIFGKSRWACPTDPSNQDRAAFHFNSDLCPEAFSEGLQMTTTHPYPLGVDPAWHGTRTELTYLNSVKMKLSIILGEHSNPAASRRSLVGCGNVWPADVGATQQHCESVCVWQHRACPRWCIAVGFCRQCHRELQSFTPLGCFPYGQSG